MNTMPSRILPFVIGLALSCGASAQTAYDCREISATTKQTFERVLQTGRREIGRPEEQGGAMDKPKPAAQISCDAQKWRQVAVASMSSYWGQGGGAAAAAAMTFYMDRLISEACARLNNEVERARGRVENVIRPADYPLIFPYGWGN